MFAIKKRMSFEERSNLENLKMEEIARIKDAVPEIKEKCKELFKEYLLNSIINRLKRYDWSSPKVMRTGNNGELIMTRHTFAVEIMKPIVLKYAKTRKCATTPALDLNDQFYAYYRWGIGCGIGDALEAIYETDISSEFLKFLKENKIVSGYDSKFMIILEPMVRKCKELKKNGC